MAIAEGKEERSLVRVEVYLLEFKLYLTKTDGYPDEASVKQVYLSKRERLRELALVASAVYKLKDNVRIWDWEDETDTKASKAALMSNMDLTIEQTGLIHQQNILVERAKGAGVWPRDSSAFILSNSGTDSSKAVAPSNNNGFFGSIAAFFRRPKAKKKPGTASSGTSTPNGTVNGHSATENGFGDDAFLELVARAETSEFPPGLCGLRNLGNTCFMNSALQCLSNTSLLRNYFLEGRYKDEINEKNALGMQGNIAKQYGALLRAIWSGDNSHFVPKNFKTTLGRWAPQFEGFNQHDAHELLAFLLDGLHEDLNRISGKKPYVEVAEGKGRPDAEVAEEAWSGHLRRNSSVIVDLFHGQLKSTVTCPDCGHISVTFDPFMYLSLPLQQESSRNIEISLWRLNLFERATKYSVKVPRGGKVSDVRKELARLAGISHKHMIITEMSDSRPVSFLQDSHDTASFAYGRAYMAYEFPNGSKPAEKRKTIAATMLHRSRSRAGYSGSYGHPWTFQLRGLPFVLEIVRGVTTGRDLYQAVWNKSERFLKLSNPEDDSDDEDEEDEESEESSDAGDANDAKDTNGEASSKPASTAAEESNASSAPSSEAEASKPTPAPSHAAEQPRKSNASSSEAKRCLPPYLDPRRSDTFPFKLAFTNSLGKSCHFCGNICDGCVILPNDEPIFLPPSVRAPTISIEWSAQVLDHYYVRQEACGVTIHQSLLDARADTKKSEANLALRDCLTMYTTTERLSELDPWYCPTCKEHRCAWKKLDLWKLPEVLVIHLKRFHFSATHRTKIGWLVDFPLHELGLDEFIINPDVKGSKYELFAVANHMGGLSSGHYTANARCDVNGKWYTFDDSNVSKVRDSKNVVSPSAYVLFYRRSTGSSSSSHGDGSSETPETVEISSPTANGESNDKTDTPAPTSSTASAADTAASTPKDSPKPTKKAASSGGSRAESPAKKPSKSKKSDAT